MLAATTLPHVGNGRQLFLRRGLQRVQRTEAIRQISGGLAAHVGNAQREQKRVQRAVAALFNGGDQVLRPLLLKAVQRQQIVGGQAVQVGAVPQAQPVVEQLRRLVREGINVHGVAAGEVAEARHGLGLAGLAVHAEQMGAPALQRLTAGGADGGRLDGPFVRPGSPTRPMISGITSLERRIHTSQPTATFLRRISS